MLSIVTVFTEPDPLVHTGFYYGAFIPDLNATENMLFKVTMHIVLFHL